MLGLALALALVLLITPPKINFTADWYCQLLPREVHSENKSRATIWLRIRQNKSNSEVIRPAAATITRREKTLNLRE